MKNQQNKNLLSRRDALKVIGLSPVAASVLLSSSASSEAEAAEDVSGKIVIVGGGAGALMALARLKRAIKNPDIAIIAPNEIHLYQPGQVFIAAGEMQFKDIVLHNSDYIDSDEVKWIKDEVSLFDPEHNSVTTRAGKKIEYDYLVVATGVVYHYEDVKGLTKNDIGTNGIASVYLNDLENGTAKGAVAMWQWFNELKEQAKSSKPKVIYTQPDTPIKCGGAPQKVLYLSADYLKKDGLSAHYTFATGLKKLFSLKEVDAELHKVQSWYDKIENRFQHHLESIDVKAKKATFVHAYEEKVYDEDFGEYTTESRVEKVVLDYDFIHITPKMTPCDALVQSSLISSMGWLDVNKETLQHKKYKNVFGIGDVCGVPMGKTGGSARHHGPILTSNLISQMKHEKFKKKFDGYTVCPLKVEYGKIIMAEFNYKGSAPTIPFLAYEKPRWMWWAFDLYMLKPMYQYLMLTGRF